jgi:hypothetical protein
MIRIDKTHSKTDLTDLINNLNLKITFSHQDNKKDIQDKLLLILKNKKLNVEENFYGIKNRDHLITYLKNQNPKKMLSIKQKADVMAICKSIIQYCKNDFDLSCCDYNSQKDIEDDMDYVKQFGDISSVRRCCRLLKADVKMCGKKFTPLISPQVQKMLDEKNKIRKIYPYKVTIRHSTPENKIIVYFD